MGQAKCSIEWCAFDPIASEGLVEALRTLVSDFGSPTVLTRPFMQDMLGTNDKTKLLDNAHDLRLFKIGLENFSCIMVSQEHRLELDSELVLQYLFHCLSDWLRHIFEAAFGINGEYVPSYKALVSCMSDALK